MARALLALGVALVALPCAAYPERPVVGMWVTDVYDLDVNNRSFTVQFWIWSLAAADAKIDPLAALDFRRARSISLGPPLVVKHGDTIWTQRFVKLVVRNQWDIRSFPFDRHDLKVMIVDALYDEMSLVYRIDTANSGIDPDALPKTWHTTGFRASEVRYTAPTTYGDPALAQPRSRWSQIDAVIMVERDAVGIFLKLLIGAYVAVMLALLSFRIKTDQPTLFSARLGLLVGSLFATVVNLRSTEAVIGRTDDFTLVDKIHLTIAIYIICAAVAALLSRRLNDSEKPKVAIELDRLLLIVFSASFVAVNVLVISHAILRG